jgi:hypothetical protein
VNQWIISEGNGELQEGITYDAETMAEAAERQVKSWVMEGSSAQGLGYI